MSSMNERTFFDLAMKIIAKQATEAERSDLDTMMAGRPELKAEFERLRAETNLAKALLPMVEAAETATGKLPAYARERLQTKVRQTLGRPAIVEKTSTLSWRLWWVLVPATALIVFLLATVFIQPRTPIVQLAMFDMIGSTRTEATNELVLLQKTWKREDIRSFSKANDLDAWESNWQLEVRRPQAKIVYDRASGEVRVSIRWKGQILRKSIPVDSNLPLVLQQAKAFVTEGISR